LKEGSFRRTQSTGRPGRLLWGSWYFALDDRTRGSDLAALAIAMQRGAPPNEIHSLATAAVESLPDYENHPSTLLGVLSRPADDSWRWDQYAQWYLGLRALEASLKSRKASTEALSGSLEQLSERLQIPAGFDSAVSFNPSQAEIRDLVERVRKQLSEFPRQMATPPGNQEM
jgi:hypothetical protein